MIPERFRKGYYAGNKWGGKFLRAPEIFYTILKKGKGKLVRLGDIAEVRFGIKTGANDFFYLPSKYFDIKEEGDYYRLIPKQDNLPRDIKIEKEFLKPVIKSPKECKTIIIKPEDLKHKVFICNKSKKELKGIRALKYIEWGEKMGFNKRPTCASRKLWWGLGDQEVSLCNYPMVNYDRLIVTHNKLFYNDANLVGIYPKRKELWTKIFTLLLNASYNMIYWELYGIANLGEGAIKQNPVYFKTFYIINPVLFKNEKDIMESIFDKIGNREIRSIFEELGFDPSRPIREQEPNPLPDRAELDNIIFDELGLTEKERKEVYWAVAELVKQRLEKARSLKKKGEV